MNDLVLIVGGTSGIGYETANYLLNKVVSIFSVA